MKEKRICEYCGKEYIAAHPLRKFCSGPHYNKCCVCGKEFEIKNMSMISSTCSRKCASKLRKQTLSKIPRTCKICGKIFYSSSNTACICSGPHFKKCEVCGREMDITKAVADGGTIPQTCSVKCRNKLTKATCIERYGYESPHMRPESRAAFSASSKASTPRRRATSMARYGVPFACQDPAIRKKISETISSNQNQQKMKSTMQQRYGVNYAMQSPKLAAKHSGNQFAKIASDGVRVDSSWELAVYEFLRRNNIPFTYQVPYLFDYNGSTHTTYIDFKVGDRYFEVKGSHLLEGTYDEQATVPSSVKIEIYKKLHVVVITDASVRHLFDKSGGLKYLDQLPDPLIGVDIDLFNSPEFPADPAKPPMFYDVKVDGGRSAREGFSDELTVWKMILNRIDYMGGFIDSKAVLRAMNVTRTCKQPSWFAKSRAVDLICKYASSPIIVDCFAGWGTRHDAAVECKRQYIGIDLNSDLVAWHQANGRSISQGDATTFTYSGDCSVLICPPYSDPATGRCFEDYNYSGFDSSLKSYSQCDWLDIIRKNIPNAREYIMVCKLVDERYSKYIAETITNKSHLGTNNEYVVVVRNSLT